MTDFFSKRLGIYEDVHLGHWPEEYAHIADFFRDGLNSLLDIGCGTGLELNAVYRRFPQAEVTGIDLCRDMMDKLQQTYRDKHFKAIVADYFECPFEAERYDAALSFETLHHFPYEKKKRIYQSCTAPSNPADTISNAITWPAALRRNASAWSSTSTSAKKAACPATYSSISTSP